MNRAHTVYAVVWRLGAEHGIAAVSTSHAAAEKMREAMALRAMVTDRDEAVCEVVAVPSGRLDRTFL